MKNMRFAFVVVFAVFLFLVTQITCFFSVGALQWFFANLPVGQLESDYPVMAFLHSGFGEFIIQWLPIICVSFSILLFMSQKIVRAYLLIVFPLIPAAISLMLFYNAAQMHVPAGEELFSSGVLIGEEPSAALMKEPHHAD